MPNYNFINTLSNEESTIWFDTIRAKEEFTATHPHMQQILTPVHVGDPHTYGRGQVKDSTFDNKMRTIADKYYGNNINRPNITEI